MEEVCHTKQKQDIYKHCQPRRPIDQGVDKNARRKLLTAMAMSLTFMTAEAVGGVLAGSIAIVSDAAHLLTDFASFLISLLSVYLASRKASNKLSFGWYRAEVIGALLSMLFLWVITAVLVYMAIQRCITQDFEVEATIMLITAGCGVAYNIIMAVSLYEAPKPDNKKSATERKISYVDRDCEKLVLSGENNKIANGHVSYGAIPSETVADGEAERKDNINVKAAFIHVLGDLLQSVGVLTAAYIIYFKPEWKLADPICTFTFSVFVVITTLTIMRDILHVLMEGTPSGIDLTEIKHCLFEIGDVRCIHHLRVWSLSMDKAELSVHLVIEQHANAIEVMKQASYLIQTRFEIHETTIQVEEAEDDVECSQCHNTTFRKSPECRV